MNPKQLYFGLLGLIALIVLGGVGTYYLSHQSLSAKITHFSELNVDIGLQNQRLRELRELETAYAAAAPTAEKTGRILPSEKLQSEVSAQIFAMIRSAGLSSDTLSYQPTTGLPGGSTQTTATDVAGVLVMPVTFSVGGSYEQLLRFLDNIEHQERLMQVQALDIARSAEEDLSFNIQLEVFLQP